jgi:hypothetical protein
MSIQAIEETLVAGASSELGKIGFVSRETDILREDDGWRKKSSTGCR